MDQRGNQTQVWPSGGGASLALSRVAALVGPGAAARAEAGLLCHPSAAGGAPRSAAAAAPYSLPGPAEPSWTAGPLVPPVALSGGPGLLLFHVQPDVSAELYGLWKKHNQATRLLDPEVLSAAGGLPCY